MTPEQQLELERNRVVAQLAGAVAHKLKQPLAVAWGYLELLFDDPRIGLDKEPFVSGADTMIDVFVASAMAEVNRGPLPAVPLYKSLCMAAHQRSAATWS